MSRILLYTYIPFGQYKRNAAKELVEALQTRSGLSKMVLKNNYDLEPLYSRIRSFKPAIVLGIGQSSEHRVKVETTFRNAVRLKLSWKPRPIGEKAFYKSNLPVGRIAEVLDVPLCDDAGTRNCNFSAYKLLERGGLKVGFIHVPSVKFFRKRHFSPLFEEVLDYLQKRL